MSFKLNYSRREFLSLAPKLAPLLGVTLLPRLSLSQAQEVNDHLFCLIILDGGWDVTLGLDPWTLDTRPDPKDLFIEYPPSDLIKSGVIFLGPAAAPLREFSSSLCVINGVFMNPADNGHSAALSYISTGNPTGTRPDLTVEIAGCRDSGPFGVVSNFPLQTKESSILVSTTNEISLLTSKENPTAFFQLLQSLQKQNSDWTQALNSLLAGAPFYDSLINQLKSMLKQYQNLLPAHIAAATFATGACTEAQLQMSSPMGNLDTHSQHIGNHLRIQKNLWEQVADVFKVFQSTPFKNSNLFEHTTFMVASEFARTAALNSAGGKDHNPLTNSVLLAGRGIRGNQVLGGSKVVTRQESESETPYHIALPWDFELNKTVTSPQQGRPHMIYPDTIARTLVEILKINPQLFKSVLPETRWLSQVLG